MRQIPGGSALVWAEAKNGPNPQRCSMLCQHFQAVFILLCVAATVAAEQPRPTRLYVKTTPPGAEVRVDGSIVGRSNDLFQVDPGHREIFISKTGFISRTHQVTIAEAEITRLKVSLNRDTGDALDEGDGVNARKAAASLLTRAEIAPKVLDAIETVLRQYPDQDRWSGRSDRKIFGIATKTLPKSPDAQQRIQPALMELVRSLAIHEMITARTLLNQFADHGLTDATSLKKAVQKLASGLDLRGNVGGLEAIASVEHDFVIGYAVVDIEKISGVLLAPKNVEDVRLAYRDVLHAQARKLMGRQQWSDALLIWKHLHVRELVSPALYLDAARCLKELDVTVHANLGRGCPAVCRVMAWTRSSYSGRSC